MENLQQILDRFLEFLQTAPDRVSGLWETIGKNNAALTVLIAFLALLVAIFGLRRRRDRKQDTPPPGADRDRQAMLAKIQANWIKPWLESDLYQKARVELKLTERDDAVQTRIHRYNQTGGDRGAEIPSDKPIEAIFGEAAGQLLILGDPGTGKSTKLIELAQALLNSAESAPTKPIPVILNLSSWTRNQAALGEWIQSELLHLYGVSRPRARQWVEGEEIVPLLDGLDEVAAEQQSACVEAINTHRRQRGLQPMAVCCRREEYSNLPAPLDLAGGIEVEPLARVEVETYLDKHGSKLQRVREALRDDPQLWDLMNTPLMLTVLFLASGVEGNEARSEPDPRRRLYLRFVSKMLDGPRNRQFSKKRALRWLGWLAAQLVNRDQIPFALEDLDLEWLPSRRARHAASLIFSLVGGLVGGLGVGLLGGLLVGLVGGLVGGLLGGWTKRSIEPVDALDIDWSLLPQLLVGWLIDGLVVGLVFGLVGWLGGWLVGGLGGGLGGWLVVGLGGGLVFGLVFGLVLGLVVAVVFGLFFGLVVGLDVGLIGGLVGGLVFGLLAGLLGGLNEILRPAPVSKRSAANEGTSRSLRYALRISSAGVVLAIAIAWLLSVLRGGPEGAVSDAVKAAQAAPAMVAWLAVVLALKKGGFFVLGHWAVRFQLQRLDLAPRQYVDFFNEAAAMLFLRKTGGAYQFFHVTFRDFVAETYGAEWLAKDRPPPESRQTATAN